MAVHSLPGGAWRRVLAYRMRKPPVDHTVLAAVGCVLAALMLYLVFAILGGGDPVDLGDEDARASGSVHVAARDRDGASCGTECARGGEPVRGRCRRSA